MFIERSEEFSVMVMVVVMVDDSSNAFRKKW